MFSSIGVIAYLTATKGDVASADCGGLHKLWDQPPTLSK